jgi:hypothetical protein
MESFDEVAPASYVRRCLEEKEIPYQISKDAHPGQVGEGIVFDVGGREKTREFIKQVTARWIAEGRV